MHRIIPVIAACAVLLVATIVLALRFSLQLPVQLAVPHGQSIRGLTTSETDRFAALWIHCGPRLFDYRIEVVSMQSGATKFSLSSMYPRLVAFSHSDRYLAVLDVLKLSVIDLVRNKTILSIPAGDLDIAIGAIAFSQDETAITAADEFGAPVHHPHSWSLKSAIPLSSQPLVKKWCGPRVSPDKSRVRLVGWPGPIPRICDSLAGPAYQFVPEFPYPWQFASGFTPDSKGFYSVHEGGAAYLWRFERHADGSAARLVTMRVEPSLKSARGISFMNMRQSIAFVDDSNKLRTVALTP